MEDLDGEKLNLTAGKRTAEDNQLDPEMDKLFTDFMSKIEQDPQAKGAFDEMGKMFEQMMTGEGAEDLNKMMGGMMGGDGADGKGAGDVDQLTDMLLDRFMDKELLYEPL